MKSEKSLLILALGDLNLTMAKVKTTASVQAGDFTGATPEFGRVADVTRIYGIKRGTLYNLLADGKVCEIRHLPNTFPMEKPYRYG